MSESEETNFFLNRIYEKKYKQLLIIPLALLILSLLLIGAKIATTGDFVNKGVSLAGGVTIRIANIENTNPIELKDSLSSQFPDQDISVRSISALGENTGLIIESDALEKEQIDALSESIKEKLSLTDDDLKMGSMKPSLGASFFRESMIVILIAFIFMGIVVYFYFRVPVPSIAVILAAFSDIVVTLAIFNLLGSKLSTAGIAGFLMLIGYSVDTDILLSTRVLKSKEGTILSRTYSAMKTGLTMSLTTIVAISVGLVFAQSEVLRQIMTILLIGLLVDLINTWLQNAGILRWYLERKHKHG